MLWAIKRRAPAAMAAAMTGGAFDPDARIGGERGRDLSGIGLVEDLVGELMDDNLGLRRARTSRNASASNTSTTTGDAARPQSGPRGRPSALSR
jgi:hypothetical protein